jgi:hypothetical protein
MVRSLSGEADATHWLALTAARWRTAHRRAVRAGISSERRAERAYRLAAALDQREAARADRIRRWGIWLCHMPNEPREYWLDAGRRRR